jgi:WD40 repeat protein
LKALRTGNDNLTICGRVDSHYYSRTFGNCYWCDRSANLGVDIFPGVVKAKPSVVVESTIFAATNTLELVKQEGKIITVVGQVANTRHLSSTNIFFINFGNVSSLVNGYSPFTIVIFSEGLKNLSNSRSLTITQLSNWVGSYIKITGTLEVHQKSSCNTPQIILKDSNQISLISQAEANNLIAGNTNINTSAAVKQTQSQVSQRAVSQPQNQSVISSSTAKTVSSSVQPTQSKVSQTNQSTNTPRHVSQPPVYKPQSQPVKTPFVSDTKLRKLLIIATLGFIGTQLYGYVGQNLLRNHPDKPTPKVETLTPSSTEKTLQLQQTLTGHSDSVNSVAYSPDGQTLASGSVDSTIKLWNVKTGNLLQTLEGHSYSVNSVAYSPDGQTLASGSEDNTIKLWNVKTGKLLQTLEGHSYSVNSVAYSPDGQTLASGSVDSTIKLWNVKTGNLLQTLEGHSSWVNSVTYSPDGQTLASGSEDNTIKLWNVKTGKLLQTLEGHSKSVYSVAYSPDGQTLASGSGDDTIKLWNVPTGNLLQTLTGHYILVWSVAYSPDGQTLASGSSDKTIKIWRLK